MYKYTNSLLLAAFKNYFELIMDVHLCNTRQIKIRQFPLPKAHSNSGANMIKYNAIEIWLKIPLELKKNMFGAFQQIIENMYYLATRHIFYVLFIDVHEACTTYSPQGFLTAFRVFSIIETVTKVWLWIINYHVRWSYNEIVLWPAANLCGSIWVLELSELCRANVHKPGALI